MTSRRGASLVELLVAVALFTLVCALGAAIVRAQRTALGALAGSTQARAALRHAAAALELELRAATLADPPRLLGDSAVELLVPVAEGVLCATPADSHELLLWPRDRAAGHGRTRWREYPEPGDVVAALVRADSAGGRWLHAVVQEVGERVSSGCAPTPGAPAPAGSAPHLRTDAPIGASLGRGTVVRVERRLRYALYRGGDGSWQLGQRRCAADGATCGGIQPVAGPLASRSTRPDRAGFRARLVDAGGAATADGRLLQITLRAPREPRQPLSLPGAARAPGRDSLALWVAIRNRP